MPALFQVEKGTFDLDDVVLKPTAAEPLLAAAKAAQEADRRAAVPPEQPDTGKWPPELHVEGRRVLDASGKEVWLQGVNVGGLETLPQDRHVMKSALVGVDDWKANIIRLPVREDFWFGRSPYQQDGGEAYRELVDNIITLVANRHAYVLLDLHRFRAEARARGVLERRRHALQESSGGAVRPVQRAARHFLGDLRDGGLVTANGRGLSPIVASAEQKGTVPLSAGRSELGNKTKADEDAFLSDEEKAKAKQGYQSPGMQALLNAVRETGARNIVVAGGLSWAADLSGIAKGFALDDKSGNGVMYGWHVYNWHKNWEGAVLGAAEKYPIFVGEVGADVKKLDFIPAANQEDPYTWVPDMLGFIQQHKLHWTAWCLHPAAAPLLISDWNYTPTAYWGAFVKDALSGKQFEMKKER